MRSLPRFARPLAAVVPLLLVAGLATAPSASADPNPTLVDIFDASGTTHIKSIDTDTPLGPTTLTETLDLVTFDIVAGTLPLPSKQVQFKALGIAPTRATVSFIQVGQVTGKVTPQDDVGNLSVRANVKYTVKLSDIAVRVLGVWTPLFVGDNCRTKDPVDITTSTPPGKKFDVVEGGPVAGTYTIGKFRDCAPLQFPDVFGIGSLPINALVPGSGNTVSLDLTNGRFGG